jgi:hypothetical protein
MNITMESLSSADAPPLAPDAPTLTPAQFHFLQLHVLHHVERWRWYWFETMLRAHASKRSATIWKDAADELVALGLMEWGMGFSMRPTAAGAGMVMRSRAAKVELVP